MSYIGVSEGSVRRVRQLTGEFERSPGGTIHTLNRTLTNYGLVGTDLGSSFFDGQRLWFLFGDTWWDPQLSDSIAWTTDPNPDDGLNLTFVTRNGQWAPIVVAGRSPEPIGTREFDVPTGGFALAGRRYVIFTSDHYSTTIHGRDATVMGSSSLCRQRDPATLDLTDLTFIFELSNQPAGGRFINAAPVVVQNPPPGLRFDGPAVFCWGSGTYRHSHCYLAVVSAATPADRAWPVEDQSAWWYFTGLDAAGAPQWSHREGEAVPLFLPPAGSPDPDGGIGELSAAWIAPLGVWLVTYGGTTFRTAAHPWGPWSPPQTLDNHADPAVSYGGLMHVTWNDGGIEGTDLLYDRGRGMDGGGPYGPYLIDRFTRPAGRSRAQIWFTLSSWNPYQAHLMTAVLERRPGDLQIDLTPPARIELQPIHHDRVVIGGPLPLAQPTGGLSMMRSRFGPAGNNFELIVPSNTGGLLFTAARNDPWPPAWGPSGPTGRDVSPTVHYDAAAMALAVTPDAGIPQRDRLMVTALTGSRMVYFYREAKQPWPWSGPYPVIAVEDDDSRHPLTGVRGNPALVASTFGTRKANLELLVPDAGFGLRHYWFDNDPVFPLSGDWRLAPGFGFSLGRVDAVAAVQSVFGPDSQGRGNLEVVVRRSGELFLLWREATTMIWRGPYPLVADSVVANAATGIPALLQSQYGLARNDFQLITPWRGGGLAHFWRDNSAAAPDDWRWHGPALIDPGVQYAAATLVAGPFGPAPGNLELAATAADCSIRHFYREATGAGWHDAGTIPV